MAVVMTAPEMNAFLQKVFLEVAGEFHVEEVTEEGVVLRLLVQDRHLRPGGTVSGPAMFGLADVTAYMVTLAHIGPRALAVTTNCSIDFMRKPKAGVDLIAHGRLLKLGKQLSVTDALLFSEGDDKPVARASLTYAVPPQGVDLQK
ncbi:PaaI family thioesterase [uncultured Tateyamaria sp.]|uniref:PaaI family thioesterase n=1 Tax=uncultured Tateyamaria sp. TaxID=455651 RepID=UPI00262EB725|nr:PaaI family thioesterase [uncultured Tateyamaria sp.]